jgi:Icc-related predicted phosphoesterase
MRILAAADLHGDRGCYRWIASAAAQRGVDAVVLAGDLLGGPGDLMSVEDAQRAQAAEIESILAPLAPSVPVFYVMGNDDWVDLEPRGPGLVPIHGRRVEHAGFTFVGYACTLPFVGGPFEKPETEIAEDLARIEPLVDARTVLVTHGPVAGILDSTEFGPAGSVSLRDLVARRAPAAHVHGHVHSSFGRVGRHFNVAAGGLRRAMLIDLPALTHEAIESC